MKMAKKLLAVVLTGVMALSMLTGCALGDAAKAKALESALNSKTLQTGATTIKYNYDHSLNNVAGRVFSEVYQKDEKNITETSTNLWYNANVDTNNKKYAYFVVEAPEKADMKHAVDWDVTTLDSSVKDGTTIATKEATKPFSIDGKIYTVKNHASSTAEQGKVDFGVKFYSKTVSGTTTNYAIVVVELEEQKAAQ